MKYNKYGIPEEDKGANPWIMISVILILIGFSAMLIAGFIYLVNLFA